MKQILLGLFTIISAILFIATPSKGDPKPSDLVNSLSKELTAELKGKQVVLRGSIHQNPKTYYEANGRPYYYEHSRLYPTIFRIREDEPVEISSIKSKGDAIEVQFVSKRFGAGLVYFSAPLHSPTIDRSVFNKAYALCFKDLDSNQDEDSIIGNAGSKMFHISGCNHLPEAGKRISFKTKLEAEASGMTPCKLCFLHVPLLYDYATERTLGLYSSQQIQALGQLSYDDSLQAKATLIGQRVLKNWPIPLQGYQYKFSVMDDDEVNAYALPTGFVYVNRGLLDVAESDLEIEGVLAHEIAHVERRHSLRIYRNEQKRQAIAAGVGALFAAIAGASAKNNKEEKAEVFGGLSYVFAKAVTDAFYEGYPRSMEEEADATAALYLEQKYGEEGLLSMTTVLKKLRYYGDFAGSEEKQMRAFRSHPLLDDRIAAYMGSTVISFANPPKIVGFDSANNEVIALTFTCQRQTSTEVATRFSLDPTQILGRMSATAEIGQPRKLMDLVFTTSDGKRIKLDNKEDSLIGPYEEVGFLLRGDLKDNLDKLDLSEVSVTLPGSKLDWKIVK